VNHIADMCPLRKSEGGMKSLHHDIAGKVDRQWAT